MSTSFQEPGAASAAPVPTTPVPTTPARRAVLLAFLIVGLLGVYGAAFSPFVPTPLGVKVSIAGALPLAVLAGLAALNGVLSPANPRFAPKGRTAWLKNTPFRVIVCAFFGYAFGYTAIEGGALSIWTGAAGVQGRQAMVIDGWRYASRSTCHGFNLRGVPLLSAEHGLCADSRFRPEAIPGRTLVLSGRASPFGVNVARFDFGPAPSAAPRS